MARLARAVVPGVPHHVTQRGNRRQRTFFKDEDYRAYLKLMAEYCTKCGVEIWAYCLMPNHIHLMAVPKSSDKLARAIGEAHRRYTRMINFRKKWRGCLWQGRFSSCALDESHTLECTRYIEMNPVRAKLVKKPDNWQWSSARFHLSGADDPLVTPSPLVDMVSDWSKFLRNQADSTELLQLHERTGRPLGSDAFLGHCEKVLGRTLGPRKPGRKKKENE